MSDLVGNPEDRFSQNEARIVSTLCIRSHIATTMQKKINFTKPEKNLTTKTDNVVLPELHLTYLDRRDPVYQVYLHLVDTDHTRPPDTCMDH